jgi:lambda family phage portal protein
MAGASRNRILSTKKTTASRLERAGNPAYDADGRPNVVHIFDSSIATNRGISPLTPILKVVRQVDQFADATLTKALIQTIFAATIKSNVPGIQAFEGLMTTGDTTGTDIDGFAAKKGEWYESAKIDMTQHGRLGHLFPGDELVFTESTSPGQQYDQFMGWLMREIAAGAGVTYESATGDFRGATYSSIRMGGAMEWLGVLRRRANIIIPFCQAWFNAWLEEEIFTGRIPFKGGYFAFLAQRAAATRCTWSGPAQPQADDFKAARSAQVLKEIQGTTLADIAASYGRDWDDDMRQRAAENALADELDLPRPWSPVTMLETKDGQDKALEDPPADAVPTPKPAGAIADELENELEISISGD